MVIVPDEKSKTSLEPLPVSTVWPSNNIPPTLTLSVERTSPLSLLVTVTFPSMLAIMMAPLELAPRRFAQKKKEKKK